MPARRPSTRWPRARRPWRHRHLLRLPIRWWLTAVLLASVTGVVVRSLVAEAEAARSRYGSADSVVVVQRAVRAGDVISGADVAVEDVPHGLVPDGALHAVPAGRAARVDLVPGEVLVGARVAGDGAAGAAAVVPDGWRALGLPRGLVVAPTLAVGDRVDVLVTVSPGDVDDGAPPTVVVARDALVVEVGDELVSVAVPDEHAVRVAFGVAAGQVALALTGA